MRFSRKCGIPLLESDAENLSQFNYTYIFGVIAWQLWIYPGLQFSHGVSISVIYIIRLWLDISILFGSWCENDVHNELIDFSWKLYGIFICRWCEKSFFSSSATPSLDNVRSQAATTRTSDSWKIWKIVKARTSHFRVGKNHFPWFTFYSFICRATRSSSQNFWQQTNSRNSPQHEV